MTAKSRFADAPRLSRRALVSAMLLSPLAHALSRRPYGGALALTLPFGIGLPDPHAGDDWTSALFGAAIADPLYAWDAAGAAYPALADTMPTAVPGGSRVALRPGLVTAHGRSLDARDLIASLARSRSFAGRPFLAPLGVPHAVPGDSLGVVFPGASAETLADALASPATAIVSRASRPGAIDGTGAFTASFDPRAGTLTLDRNERAARGASFLDRVVVHRAEDLAGALRAFESGDADVGFLGAGLHRKRPLAVPLRTLGLGFVVLRSGPDARTWGAPGVVPKLVSTMDPGVLSHLGLTLVQDRSDRAFAGDSAAWGGDPADILVDERSAYFVEVARVVASVLSRPGHEIRPLPLSSAELRSRVTKGRYALAVDFVRRLGPTPRHVQLSLLAAADPRLADNPPRLVVPDPAVLTRTLPLAVLGELSVTGAAAPDVHALDAWDLGSVFRQIP